MSMLPNCSERTMGLGLGALDGANKNGPGDCRHRGHQIYRSQALRAAGLTRSGALFLGPTRRLAGLALRAAAVLVLLVAAANILRRRAQSLADALGLFRRVAGFSRRFARLLFFF